MIIVAKVIHHAKHPRYKVKSWPQEHPKKGAWHTDKFIHGPRIKQPGEFKSIYTENQDWAKKRHVKLPKNMFNKIEHYAKKENLKLPTGWKNKVRVKVGATKLDGLAAQSTLTPIKNFDFAVGFMKDGVMHQFKTPEEALEYGKKKYFYPKLIETKSGKWKVMDEWDEQSDKNFSMSPYDEDDTIVLDFGLNNSKKKRRFIDDEAHLDD